MEPDSRRVVSVHPACPSMRDSPPPRSCNQCAAAAAAAGTGGGRGGAGAAAAYGGGGDAAAGVFRRGAGRPQAVGSLVGWDWARRCGNVEVWKRGG
eukprot:355927-Chlamydomonas_euryale.AAC.1